MLFTLSKLKINSLIKIFRKTLKKYNKAVKIIRKNF